MKICFFNTAKMWGGGEKWHLDHALAFQEAGHDVVVVSSPDGELAQRAKKNNIRTKVFRVSNLSFLNPLKWYKIFHFFKVEKFDAVIFNFSKDLKIAAPIAKLTKIPKIVYRRGSAIPIKDTVINRLLYTCLTDIIANSQATKGSILQNNPILFPADKITVIYNGIDTKQNIPSIENEIPVVGNLGRLVYQKGQDILIDIAEILKNRNIKCKFRIGGDGPLMAELKQKIADRNLSGYVELIGFVKSPEEFMAHIDIFVLTSRGEGFGYVFAEAMLAHKPLIGFNVGSGKEVINSGQNGYLIPFEDKITFANVIQDLVENSEKREKLGENGYKILCEKFDFEKNKQEIIDFLNK
jgi:glycosyltransferase involved in cell wall biosynthesis